MSKTEKKLDAVEKRTHPRPVADRRDVGRTVARVAAVDGPWERGEYPSRDDCLKLGERLDLLEITPAVLDVVDTYISRHVMPADPAGDALHLALASVHRCDFLVTWNCRHLANANKFGHIRRVNTLLGIYVPSLVTPLGLLEDDGNED